MSLVNVLRQKDEFTANGAITNSTSLNACLDLFFLAGACRNESEQSIINKLISSYSCDPLKTMKIIFWAGDIRQGAGERRFFEIALSWLLKNHTSDLYANLEKVPEFSRWTSLFNLATDKNVVDYLVSTLLNKEAKGHSLLCKWLPRQGSVVDVTKVVRSSGRGESTKIETRKVRKPYGGLANIIRKAAKLSPKEYRKILVEGTSVVETLMCSNKWDEIEYSKIPSVAMNKYNKAWYRRGGERFANYLESLKKGEAKINAGAIFPHDIVKHALQSYYNAENLNDAQIEQWKALPNYLGNNEHSILPVCDVSGSMHGLPLNISVGLGLYLSERNRGAFQNAFITFSERPRLQYLEGDINARIHQLSNADWGGNTNISAVFELILRRGIEEKVPQEDMPRTVLIISDMEFDYCGEMTNFENIQRMYIEAGYEIPNIVFWNVNGRAGNVPIRVNDKGVALISGASPSIIKGVLSNDINPEKVMNSVIESERYSSIKLGA